MESSEPKPQLIKKCPVAVVQGESFRCMAVEYGEGVWRKYADGSPLPPVIEVVKVTGYCELAFLG